MTEFFMDMIPPTATRQQRGCAAVNGKRVYYDRSNGGAEAKLTAYLAQHIPDKPYTGAVQVVIKWCFPLKAKHRNAEPHTSRPDADNLCKSLLDIMTRLHYWGDDRQIYSLVCEKFWADRPGIYIRIRGGGR